MSAGLFWKLCQDVALEVKKLAVAAIRGGQRVIGPSEVELEYIPVGFNIQYNFKNN